MITKNIKDRDLAVVIAKIMRWGIIAAISMAFTGGIMYLFKHSSKQIDYKSFKQIDKNIFQLLSDMRAGILALDGRSFIMLGIVLLFATPLIRVVFSLIGFILEKDRLYIVITLIVLAIIIISISGGLGG